MSLKVKTKERVIVRFTDQERLEKGSEISELISENASLKDDLKYMKKRLEAQIAEKDARINLLSEDLRTGQEFRAVDCLWEYNWLAGIKICMRPDTCEIVKTEIITDDERQTKLDLDAAVEPPEPMVPQIEASLAAQADEAIEAETAEVVANETVETAQAEAVEAEEVVVEEHEQITE
jgi:hypothetical protein